MSSLKSFFIFLKTNPFLFSCLIIALFKFWQLPSLTYNAEVFAESGTNFFINAYEGTIFQNLLILDAGYLPLLQRIVAVFAVKMFPIALYPFVTQFVAICFIAIMASIINIREFRKICPSDFIRFALGLSIAFISDYELNTLINFSYYGVVLLFLGIFLDKQKMSTTIYSILVAASSLVILSKGHFVIFIPIFLFLAFRSMKMKMKRTALFYYILLAASFIQLVSIYINTSFSQSQNSVNLLYLVGKTIYYFLLTHWHVFFGYVEKGAASYPAMFFVLILLGMGLKKAIIKKNYATINFFLVANFIAICSLFLTVAGLSNKTAPITSNVDAVVGAVSRDSLALPEQKPNIFYDKHLANLRSLFFSNLLVFLAGSIVIVGIFPRKSEKFIILAFFFLSSGAFAQIKAEEPYPVKDLSYSQWGLYSDQLNAKSFCIPINHYPFILKRNCTYLYPHEGSTLFQNKQLGGKIILNSLDSSSYLWKVKAVIVIDEDGKDYKSLSASRDGVVVSKAKLLVPSTYKYKYFIFEKEASGIESLEALDVNGNIVKSKIDVVIMGTK